MSIINYTTYKDVVSVFRRIGITDINPEEIIKLFKYLRSNSYIQNSQEGRRFDGAGQIICHTSSLQDLINNSRKFSKENTDYKKFIEKTEEKKPELCSFWSESDDTIECNSFVAIYTLEDFLGVVNMFDIIDLERNYFEQFDEIKVPLSYFWGAEGYDEYEVEHIDDWKKTKARTVEQIAEVIQLECYTTGNIVAVLTQWQEEKDKEAEENQE